MIKTLQINARTTGNRKGIEMTEFELEVLRRVHDAPYVEQHNQRQDIADAIGSLHVAGCLAPSCLKRGALESSHKGAKLLGYA
jgi:hypothetical protein